jgi:hypothetical protein
VDGAESSATAHPLALGRLDRRAQLPDHGQRLDPNVRGVRFGILREFVYSNSKRPTALHGPRRSLVLVGQAFSGGLWLRCVVVDR